MRGELDIRQEVPLAPLCSLELGGPARYLVTAKDEQTVWDALEWAKNLRISTAFVGSGTNLVISDAGFDGLVVLMRQQGTAIASEQGRARLTAMAGQSWDDVVEQAVAERLTGIECLSGVPGSAGATVVQNVGAYGQEVADTIESVRVLDRRALVIRELPASVCGFAYRQSAFKRDPEAAVVLAVTFGLKPGAAPVLRYPELRKELGAGAAPDLARVRETVLALRRGKSMLLEAGDENRRSAGSFFLNPVLEAARAAEVVRRALQTGAADRAEEVPRWTDEAGRVKLAAAWLIEKSGFARGHRAGPVGISSRHALALVHHGGGSTAELLALGRQIRDAVLEKFGVRLHPEPAFLGFPEPPL